MRLFVLFQAMLVVASSADKCEEKCAKCEVIERSECIAGMQKDAECGCCDVCSRHEGQICDKNGAPYKYGQCGNGLECRSVADEDICQCVWEEIVCGTDGVTYDNLCHLIAAAVREPNGEPIEVKSSGPCDPGAQIVSKPEYVRNTTNNNAVLSCEAIGFPTPSIKWIVTKANNKTFPLPGDDNHILVSTRGGPGKYQITGWLQIELMQKHHEGYYTCIAFNKHREDRAKARIKVVN